MTEPLLTQQEAADLPELLTGDEVADLLRVSKRTVERLNLPYIKVGRLRRYLRDDIRDYYRLKRATT